jgi:hypothetical protein
MTYVWYLNLCLGGTALAVGLARWGLRHGGQKFSIALGASLVLLTVPHLVSLGTGWSHLDKGIAAAVSTAVAIIAVTDGRRDHP